MNLPVGQIIHADCLEFMRTLPDGCVDACITDPPYGQDAGNTGASRGMTSVLATARDYGGFAWDKARPAPECFAEIIRVSKVQAIFGGNFFADLLPPTRCWYCWDKGRRNDFADCELVWTSRDAPARVINFHANGCMMADKTDNQRVHPTQKPVQVMARLIEDLTQPGDLILDPFCGSGSTLVAAERLGRRWIGVDISESYVEIARKRTAQKGLFGGVPNGN